MRKSCPPQVRTQGNGFAGGIHATSGPECRGAVAEDATGTGVLSAGGVGWSLNCLLNGGAVGVHPGVGNGLAGMRSDLISREARLDGL
ncbi:hypothetical protein ABT189_19000 [Streptomyces sp900105755]|uniref:hypothetical protein n=1 Tax=Streptomyces sp. 900105755 TaxID=3154389 RepID=UPI003321CAC8